MPNTKKDKIIVATVSGVFLLVVFDFVLGGTGKFYSTWISCGQKPVAVSSSGYMNAGVNHYSETQSLSIFPGVREYYCTPLEAERAGYSANQNSYDFPNLKKAGEPNPLVN